MCPRERTAFTLIELLVVISMIAMLIALLLPALGDARTAARRMMCTSNQRQLAVGVHAYAHDADEELPTRSNISGGLILFAVLIPHDGDITTDGERYPGGPGWAALHPGYVTDRNTFYCPQNTMLQWDFAPWKLLSEDAGIPWWSVGCCPGVGSVPGHSYRDMGYFYLANRPDDRNYMQTHPDAPISLSDPGSLALFADRNEFKHGRWVMGNHPGFYEYPPTGFTAPENLEPDGTNVTYLDGSVSWRDVKQMDPMRYSYLCGPCWNSSW